MSKNYKKLQKLQKNTKITKITKNVEFFDPILKAPAGVRCPLQMFGDRQVGSGPG
jgi:hypothetical protein